MRKHEGRNQSGKQPATGAETASSEGTEETRKQTKGRRKKPRKKPTHIGRRFSEKGGGLESRRAKKGNRKEALEEGGDPQGSHSLGGKPSL